jgi:hypothetical protein
MWLSRSPMICRSIFDQTEQLQTVLQIAREKLTAARDALNVVRGHEGGSVMLNSLHDALADSRAPEPDFIEPAVNLPIYCSGLAKAAVRDAAPAPFKLAFFIEQDGQSGVEHVLNLRVAMQSHAWRGTAQKIDEALAAFRRSFDA